MLAIGAHPDDIEIGAGGTLLTLAASQPRLVVRYVVLTGTRERHAEARDAAAAFLPEADVTVDLLDLPGGRLPMVWDRVKEVLEDVGRTCVPDLILAPSSSDPHQDRRTLGQVVRMVFRERLCLSYEILRWDGDLGRPRLYVPLTPEVMHRKVELLHKCFPSLAGRDGWDDEVFLGLARLRGMECRARYAEGYTSAEGGDRSVGAAAEGRTRAGTDGEAPRCAGTGRVSVLVDPDLSPPELRQSAYDGNVVVLTTLRSVGSLVDHVREQLLDLFAPYEPEYAHEHIDKTEMAKLLDDWKPRFIHSPKSKELVRAIIREAGFPAGETHYDLPKPRTSFPAGHLTTGIAHAFRWHRDTWYSAPVQQINWWLPVFPVSSDNAMCFDLQAFNRAVANSSGGFDYYRNNRARLTTAAQVNVEEQARPAALHHAPSDELVVLPHVGGVVLFSGAQLHASVPNTSGRARFSVDFRTVDVTDLHSGRGAPLVDVSCTGTAIRDFRRVSDEAAFDEEWVVRSFGEPPAGSVLVFAPPAPEGAELHG